MSCSGRSTAAHSNRVATAHSHEQYGFNLFKLLSQIWNDSISYGELNHQAGVDAADGE